MVLRFGANLFFFLIWVTVVAVCISIFWWVGATVMGEPQDFKEVFRNAWWATLLTALILNVFLLLTGKKTAFD